MSELGSLVSLEAYERALSREGAEAQRANAAEERSRELGSALANLLFIADGHDEIDWGRYRINARAALDKAKKPQS